MNDGIMLTIGDDGEATLYDDTYDITIHCESKEEQDEVRNALENIRYWIPCRKRLPEEDVDVLCQTISGAKLVASYGFLNPWSKEKGWITSEFNRLSKEMIEAWMPLPESFKWVTE